MIDGEADYIIVEAWMIRKVFIPALIATSSHLQCCEDVV
uniref:Uncharacterized protein n=1 Tax=Anguilla anguilla TaxID=7936 RepID=A0A0E9QPR0_ANGAN